MTERKKIRWACYTCGDECEVTIEPDGSHPILSDCRSCLSRLALGEQADSSPAWMECSNSRCPTCRPVERALETSND